MDVSIGAKTDLGTRENNEDAVLVYQPRAGEIEAVGLLIVADGMGGRAHGEDASSTAVKTIRETLGSLLAPGSNRASYADALAAAIRRANSDVFELARDRTGQKGMGTTCVAAVIGEDGATIAHVGDSRAYLLRDGLLRRLTEDHSYVHDQVRSGHLSDHDARNSRFRHVITKAIGLDATVKPDIKTYPLVAGDSLLLCTDGLSNIVDEAGMIQIMSRARTAQEAIDYLVDAAKRGGSKDNISGALARIGVVEMGGLADSDTGEQIHGSLTQERSTEPDDENDEPIVIDELDEPIMLPPSVSHKRIAAAMVGGAVLGALVCALFLSAVGWMRPHYHEPAPAPLSVAPSSAPLDVEGLDYSFPRVLLYEDVLPDLLAGSDAGVTVVSALTGKMLLVNQEGQIRPVGQIERREPSPPANRRYIAVDAQGYSYITNDTEPMVRRYRPDGMFNGWIVPGHLKAPTALYVARSGDIYVIDSGRLNLIHAQPGAAAKSRNH